MLRNWWNGSCTFILLLAMIIPLSSILRPITTPNLTDPRKHGTYRPTLMSLVKQNPADLVKATTQEAYTSYATSTDALKALKILTKLRGIGPATASLLLSVYQPGTVPFFSDEVFRWTHWDEQGKTGWGRSIKYCVKEYGEVIARVERVRERLGVRAVDVERVAYVLGKEGLDVDAEIEGEREDDGVGGRVSEKIAGENVEESSAENKGNVSEAAAAAIGNGEDKEEERGPKAAKKGAKRKAQDAKIPAEGTRKSTRRKL